MKLHLPVRLRSALLACCAAVTSIATTVGAGLFFAFGGMAFAETYTWNKDTNDGKWGTAGNWTLSSGEAATELPGYQNENDDTYVIADGSTVSAQKYSVGNLGATLQVGNNVTLGGNWAFVFKDITIGSGFTSTFSGDGIKWSTTQGAACTEANSLSLNSTYNHGNNHIITTMGATSTIDFGTDGLIVTTGGNIAQGKKLNLTAAITINQGATELLLVDRVLIQGSDIHYRDSDGDNAMLNKDALTVTATDTDGTSKKYDFVTDKSAAWTIGGTATEAVAGAYRYYATKADGIGIQYYAYAVLPTIDVTGAWSLADADADIKNIIKTQGNKKYTLSMNAAEVSLTVDAPIYVYQMTVGETEPTSVQLSFGDSGSITAAIEDGGINFGEAIKGNDGTVNVNVSVSNEQLNTLTSKGVWSRKLLIAPETDKSGILALGEVNNLNLNITGLDSYTTKSGYATSLSELKGGEVGLILSGNDILSIAAKTPYPMAADNLVAYFDFKQGNSPEYSKKGVTWNGLPTHHAEGEYAVGQPYTMNAGLPGSGFTVSIDADEMGDGTVLSMAIGSTTFGDNDKSVSIKNVAGQLTTSYHASTATNTIVNAINTNRWTTLTLVGTGTGDTLTLQLYVDGVLADSCENDGATNFTAGKIDKFQVGHLDDAASSGATLKMDNLLLFDVAYTEAQVKALYDSLHPVLHPVAPTGQYNMQPLTDKAEPPVYGKWTTDQYTTINADEGTITCNKHWDYGSAARYDLLKTYSLVNPKDTLSFTCNMKTGSLDSSMTLALEDKREGAIVIGHGNYKSDTKIQAEYMSLTTGAYAMHGFGEDSSITLDGATYVAEEEMKLNGLIAWDATKNKFCLTLTFGEGENAIEGVLDLESELDISSIVLSSGGASSNTRVFSNLTFDFNIAGEETTQPLVWALLTTEGDWVEGTDATNSPWRTQNDNTQVAYNDGKTYDVIFNGDAGEPYTITIKSAVDVGTMTIKGKDKFTFEKSGDGALNIQKGLTVETGAIATLNVGDLDVKALSNAGKLSFNGAVTATSVTNSDTLTAASINASGAFKSTGGTVKLTGTNATLAAKGGINISGTTLDGTWSATGAVLGAGVSVAADGNVTLTDATLGATVNNGGTLTLSGSLNIADTDAAAFQTQTTGESTYSAGDNGFKIGTAIYTLTSGDGTLTVADDITVKKNGAAVGTATFSADKKQLSISGEQIGTLYWVNKGEGDDAVTYAGTGFTGATGFALNGSKETAELKLNSALADTMKGEGKGIQVQDATANKLTINGNTVELAHSDVHINGSGTVTISGNGIYNLGTSKANLTADNAAIKLGTDWTGTVALNGANISGEAMSIFGTNDSKIQLSGCYGYMSEANDTVTSHVILKNSEGNDGYALQIQNGGNNQTEVFSGAVSGDGILELAYGDKNINNLNYEFKGDVSEWTGGVVMNSNGKTSAVSFTGGGEINASTTVKAGTLNVTIGHATKKTMVNSSIAGTKVTIAGTNVRIIGETEVADGGSLSVAANGTLTNDSDLTVKSNMTLAGALDGTGSTTVKGSLTLNGATNKGGNLTADTLNLGGNKLTLTDALTAGEITMSGITSASDPHLSIGELDATADTTLTLLKSDLEAIGNGDTAKLLTSGAAVDMTKLILSSDDADVISVDNQSVQVGSVMYTLGWDAAAGMVILTTTLVLEKGDVVWNGGDGAGENYWYSGQLKSDASVWEPIGSLEAKGDAKNPVDVTVLGQADKFVAELDAYGPDENNRIVLSGGGNSIIKIDNTVIEYDPATGVVSPSGEYRDKVVEGIYVNYTSDKEYELAGDDLKIKNNLDIQAGAVKVNNQTTVGGTTEVGANGELTITDTLITKEMTGHANATITVNAGGKLEVGNAAIAGTLTNDGSLKLTGTGSTGSTIKVLAGSGSLELTEGASATIGSDDVATNTTTVSSLTNKGSLTIYGTIQVNGYSATNGSYVEGGDLNASNIILGDGTTKLDGVFGKVYTGGITGAHVTVESGSLTNPDVDTLKVTQGVVSIWEDDKELTIGSLEGDGTVELGSASLNLTETTGGSTDVAVTGIGELVLDEISENQLGDVTADKVTVNMNAYGSTYADGDSLLTVKSLTLTTTGSIELNGDVLAGGTKYGILDIVGDLTDDMIAEYQGKLALNSDKLQAHAAAGGWVLLSDEKGVLSMEFLDAADAPEDLKNTWTVGDDATSNGLLVNGGAVPFYQSLNHVDSVAVDGDSTIYLTGNAGTAEANATNPAVGLTIRNLNGEGKLEIKGDSSAEDVATIFAPTDDSSAAGIDLVANNVTVNLGEPSTRMRFMLRAAAPGTIVLNSLTATGDAVYNVNKPTEVTNAVKLDGANTALNVLGGSLSIGGGLEGTGTITGEATITGTKADGSVFEGSYGDGAILNVTGGKQTLTTGANLTAKASDDGKLTLTGNKAITALEATSGATVVLAETAGAAAPALTADKVTIDGADLEITLNTDDAVESMSDGPVILAADGSKSSAKVANLTVNLTPTATVDVPTGEGAETVVLALLMDGASADDVKLATDDKTKTMLEKFFTLDSAMVNGDGYIVVDRNDDYFTEEANKKNLLDEENAKAGAAMLDRALVYANPQGNADEYTQLADIMTAMEGYTAAGNAKELNKLAASVAGASTASMGAALSGDMQRQLRAIRNRTTTMGVDQCVVNHDMPYFNAWINAEGNRSELDADGLNSGYTMDSWGGTVGFDVDATPQFTFGLALTAMYGDFTANSAETASGDMDSYYLTAFARYVSGRWTHTFVAAAGKTEASLERNVHGYDLKGDTDGTSIGMMYEVGYVYALDEDATACLQPVLNFTFSHSSMAGYTEEGGDAALNVGNMDMTTFTIGAGARLQTSVGENLYNRTSILEARALVKFNVGDTECEGENGIAAIPGSGASVTSADMGAVGFEVGAGLTIPVGQESGSIFVDASAELSSGYTNVNGTVGYRINF